VQRSGKIAVRPATASEAVEAALVLIEQNKALFRLQQPRRELRLAEVRDDKLGQRHIHLQQYYGDIAVWGGEIAAHVNAAGSVYSINARYSPTPSLERGVVPTLAVTEAKSIALEHMEAVIIAQQALGAFADLLGYSVQALGRIAGRGCA
jgi:Zn-dependent metalloprotease